MLDVPRPRPGHPVKIALGHIVKFRKWDERGQTSHLMFSHRQGWQRILATSDWGEIHQRIHWHLGTEAHR